MRLLYNAWNALNMYKLEQIVNVYGVDLAKLVTFLRMQLGAECWMANERNKLAKY